MKIKQGLILREVAGNFIVVAVGPAVKYFNGVISLNETGAFLWKQLEKGNDEEGLVKALLDNYEIEQDLARTEAHNFIAKLKDAGLLEQID